MRLFLCLKCDSKLSNWTHSYFRLKMHLLLSLWEFAQGQSKKPLEQQTKTKPTEKLKNKKSRTITLGIFFNSVLSCKAGPYHVSWLLGKSSAVTPNALNLPPPFPELLVLSITSYDNENPFSLLGSAVLLLGIPSLLPLGAAWKTIRLGCCVGTSQQQLKHQCVISTLLVTNPKRDTVWASMREISFIPARPSTDAKADYRNRLTVVCPLPLPSLGS